MKQFFVLLTFCFWVLLACGQTALCTTMSLEERVLEGHTQQILSLAFSSDAGLLASGSLDASIRLWNTKTAQQVRIVHGHQSGVCFLSFVHSQNNLVSADYSGFVKIWETTTGRQLWSFEPAFPAMQGGASPRFSLTRNGRFLAVGYSTGQLVIYDLNSKTVHYQVDQTYRAAPRPVTAVAFSPDGSLLAGAFLVKKSGEADRTKVIFWQRGDSEPIQVLSLDHVVNYLEFFTNGLYLVAGGKGGYFLVYELQHFDTLLGFSHAENVADAFAMAYGSSLITCGDGSVKVWDFTESTMGEVRVPQLGDSSITTVSHNLKLLAFAQASENYLTLMQLPAFVAQAMKIPPFIAAQNGEDPELIKKQLAFWQEQLVKVEQELIALEGKVNAGFEGIDRGNVEQQVATAEVDWNDAENLATKKKSEELNMDGEKAVMNDPWSKKKSTTSQAPRVTLSIERPSPALLFSLEQARGWRMEIKKKIRGLEEKLRKSQQ